MPLQKKKKVTKNKSDTHKITYELYQEGLSIDEIAKKRKLTSTTIFSHIAKLYNDGKDINIDELVSEKEVNSVREAKKELDSPNALKPYFEHFNEQLDYFKIRLALSVIDKD